MRRPEAPPGAAASVRDPGDAPEVDAGLGIATGRDGGDLLRSADVAMHAARADHAGVMVYGPALDHPDPHRLGVFGDLRRAIGAGELRVHYQPKASLHDGRVRGVEALVRREHPQCGLLMPDAFIPIAEQTGLVHALPDALLEQALADCRRWRDEGLALGVAVNLSARSLVDLSLADRITDLLHRHGLPPAQLELEITEGAASSDPRRALDVLHRLRMLGVQLSVDDYGTGQASLSYLSRLPVTALKIDRSFVSTMELDAKDRTIVRGTIELAHSLRLRVVAEGVETRQTWQQLRALGCDEAQGYLLARPTPADGVPACIAETQRRTADGAGAGSVSPTTGGAQ